MQLLSHDASNDVRMAVAGNKLIPDNILIRLTHDENSLVRTITKT